MNSSNSIPVESNGAKSNSKTDSFARETDYYKLLGVDRFATLDQIKKGYKKMAIKYHPDKGGDSSLFQQIKEAYDILKDIESKKDYDNQLMYYIETLERAKEITLSQGENSFTCTQCQSTNKIYLSSIDITKENICKCENCSMIYRISIK